MKFRTWLLILLLTLVMAACTGPTALPTTQTSLPAATKTLPSPDVSVTRTPDVRNTVETYLQAWQVEDYPAMYALLSRLTLDAVTQEDFTRSYTDVANALALAEIKYDHRLQNVINLGLLERQVYFRIAGYDSAAFDIGHAV